MASKSLSSVFSSNKRVQRVSKKDMPNGTFDAVLSGIVDGSFLDEQTGAPVHYKIVKFKVGKVIHEISLARLFFPNAPQGSNPRVDLAKTLGAGDTVEVTMTSRPSDYERGIRAGYLVVER